MSNGDRDYFERTPPSDIPAEQIVLGGMMLATPTIDSVADVVSVLRPIDHYRPAHQIIHEAILALYERGDPTDAVSVAAELVKSGELGRVGGAPYLHTCIATVPTAVNAGYYARIVREKATLRSFIATGMSMIQSGYAQDSDSSVLVDQARASIDAIAITGTDGPPSFADLLTETVIGLETEQPRGVETPWDDLNRLVGSVHGFTVVAARPSVGKSVLGLNLALHAAKHKIQSVVHSLEMGREELTLRILSHEARVPLDNLTHRKLTDEDWERIGRTVHWIDQTPIVIDDYAGATIAYVRSRIRELSRTEPVGLVVIDYLQLMTPGKSENRQQEVAALSRGLKLINREFGIPVVAMAQLNRSPEHRGDKRPMLSDLRDSGQIEADADNVWLLHRPELYDATESPGEIEVIVAKHRQGPTGTIALGFQGHYSRAVDLWTPSNAAAA